MAVRNGSPRLPFLNMVHLLLQGPVPYVAEGLQDRVMTYSIFSGGEVRQAANEGRAYYLPCTLANLDSLIGKGRRYEPDVVLMKVRQNPVTGEYSLGLSVEALHTAIDHAAGVGGQPDFIRALNDRAYGTPIIAIKSRTPKGDSKIVAKPPPGINLTASAFDGVVIVTEWGVADLRGLTTGEKAVAIASIAHPGVRDDLLRRIYEDPLFTKPAGIYLERAPRGVSLYRGDIPLAEN